MATQIQRYPTICCNANNEVVILSSKGLALFSVANDTFERMKKMFFVPRRFEKKLYKIAAKCKDANDFWDRVHSLIWTSDSLSSFLLRHFVGEAVMRFGPLGSIYTSDAIQWATTIPVCSNTHGSKSFRLLSIHASDFKLQTCLSFIKANPVFVKDQVENNGFTHPRRTTFLESLGIISYNRELQMYDLELPLIYPWHLSPSIRLRVTDDYSKRIYRDFGFELQNPLSANDASGLILRLMKIGRKDSLGTTWDILSLLKDFSNNVISILYEGDDHTPSGFSMEASFPLPLKNASSFGKILWALEDVPRVVEIMPFEWFRSVLTKAIETSRVLGIFIGMTDLAEDSAMFFASSPTADAIYYIAKSHGMLPWTKANDYGKILGFSSRRDLKRIGLISKVGIAQDEEKMSLEGFVFEILNEVMRIRPKHAILLRDLAAKLEVDPNFLLSFIERYLGNSLNLNIPGEIAPLEDPWLEF